ncbi:MAG: hypothetical protein IKX30_02575 [Victivallales bacterium]|nr:hypothetical protein [Victivallales bacterium]
MNKSLKNTLFGLGMLVACLPYACKLPYITTAWKQSPLDSHDWIFLLMGFVTLGITLFGIRRKEVHHDWTGLLLMAVFAIMYVIGLIKDIHAISIMAGVLIAASATCLFWGWECFIILLPAFVVFCLSVTSTSYWITYLLSPIGLKSLPVKIFLMVVAIVIAIIQYRVHFIPKKQSTIFVCVLCFAVLFVGLQKEAHIKSAAFIPDFSSGMFKNAKGYALDPTPGDLQFFEGSKKLEKYTFGTDDSVIGILGIELGTNVHQIHPPTHCLRTQGTTILSEKLQTVEFRFAQITITEINYLNTSNNPMLCWYWYSSPQFSTPSLISFRRHWNPKHEWHSYQITTPIYSNDLSKARERLKVFLGDVAEENSSKASKEAQQPSN